MPVRFLVVFLHFGKAHEVIILYYFCEYLSGFSCMNLIKCAYLIIIITTFCSIIDYGFCGEAANVACNLLLVEAMYILISIWSHAMIKCINSVFWLSLSTCSVTISDWLSIICCFVKQCRPSVKSVKWSHVIVARFEYRNCRKTRYEKV